MMGNSVHKQTPFSSPFDLARADQPQVPVNFTPTASLPAGEVERRPAQQVALRGPLQEPEAASKTSVSPGTCPAMPSLHQAPVSSPVRDALAKLVGLETALVSFPNKFNVCLVDLTGLGLESAAQTLSRNWGKQAGQLAFVVASGVATPNGYRVVTDASSLQMQTAEKMSVELKNGDDSTLPPETVGALRAEAEEMSGQWPTGARVIVPADSKIPALHNNAKAAGHVTLTVQVQVPTKQAHALRETLSAVEFLERAATLTPQDKDAAMEQLTLVVCARTGARATFATFADTVTDFGGSADLVVDGGTHRFETATELLRREVREEGGEALTRLFGTLHMKDKQQKTDVGMGGIFFVKADDRYTKAVSRKDMTLTDLCATLAEAKADGEEVQSLVVWAMPEVEPLVKGASKEEEKALESALKNGPFALSDDLARDKSAVKARDSQVRIAMKILDSTHFGTVETSPSSL